MGGIPEIHKYFIVIAHRMRDERFLAVGGKSHLASYPLSADDNILAGSGMSISMIDNILASPTEQHRPDRSA